MIGDEQAGARARRDLVRTIETEVAETAALLGKDRLDRRVLAALERVPRHRFVPGPQRLFAHENRPLPIGHGQTISQPYMVAVMSDMAEVADGTKVLEIGAGCGYQAAVLAELGGQVTTVELVPELAEQTAQRLAELGIDRVTVHQGDGSFGWPAGAPYDAIVVTAAAKLRVPPALLEQLAPEGRLVIPIEHDEKPLRFLRRRPDQELLVLTKSKRGKVSERRVLPVAFVPLIESAAGSKSFQ